MSEEILKLVRRQNSHTIEIIKSCPLFLRSEYDECEEECLFYRVCWSLQDKETEAGKKLSQTLEVKPIDG